MPAAVPAKIAAADSISKGSDALNDSLSRPLDPWHRIFGDGLYAEGRRLVDIGCVFEVRVLQAGRVVTGIAGAGDCATRHRVYIQYPAGQYHAGQAATQGLQAADMEAECSCGERSPCVHIAAVLIASTRAPLKPPADQRRAGIESSPQRPANVLTRRIPAQQQRLCYLFEGLGHALRGRPGTLHGKTGGKTPGELLLSVWVGQTLAGSERIHPESACPFAARPAEGKEFPRYVDTQDAEILRTLSAQHFDGPRRLHGGAGAELLQRAVATGRAFWQSFQGEPLQSGSARPVLFAWQTLPNGDQRLRGETSASVHVILDVEPAIYIDAATHEWGPLEFSCSLNLLQQFLNRPAIAPEQVDAALEAIDEQIARDAVAATFPRPRQIPVHRQVLTSLQPRLVLSAGPVAALHFIYNGLAVDGRSLRTEQNGARQMQGDVLHEIDRDRDAEQRLRTLLDQVLATTHQGTEAWLAFMMKAVPELQAQGWEVLADDDFPYRIAAANDWYADLQTDRRDAWFDLRLGVMVDDQRVNLLPALVAYLQGTLGENDASCHRIDESVLVRLDDGRYLPIAIERVQRIADTLVELLDRNSLNKQQALSLPVCHAGRLAQLTLALNGPALQSDDRSMLALIRDLEDFSGIQPLPAPANFQATLRSYQREGLGWLQFLRRYRLGGILADDMGLGKTVQTLAHLLLEKQQGRLRKPSLIVAPVSVIGNWQQEIRRFAPDLRLLTLHGSRRKESFPAIDAADIVVIGYPSLQFDSEMLLAREFCFLILDEAQTIKNPRARVSQVARSLRAEHRLCLTGTPMENHLGELWSLLDFLQPGLLGDEKQFQRHYRTPIEKNGDGRRAEALTRRIAPFVLRRTKDAVAKELPPKTQIVESIVLDERQRDFYDGIRLAMHQRVQEVIQRQGLARSQITVLDALLKLRQACCDPRLVNSQTTVERGINEDVHPRTIPSAKLEWLLTVLPELVAEGRRILLFSQFTSMLRLIEAAVTELAIPYCLLTGETQHRAEVVRRFQAGEAPLFLISLKAGGTGLNLTAADTVIHYDPWWNPAAEAQATDRAHRIGQQQPVFVYKLIAQGTVEEKIMQLQADKHALASQLYTQKNASPASLSAADLEALFAP